VASCSSTANASASPYRFDLFIDPVRWADIGDSGLAEAVVHSHLSSPPRPSRTDVENIGLWEGKPYLIYSVREDELAAWTIQRGEIAPLQLAT
jgi:proteasome lid subunit RPN8/RPN11